MSLSPTWRPCCQTLWEEDHKPGCLVQEEENMWNDDWGRETSLMSESHFEDIS